MTRYRARSDALLAVGWFALAVLARAPLVARIEGTLDHDQSVVGLMALDIAAGRRFPIFFDGQRYMGAIEGYVAAGLVRLFGHTPAIVAVSPLLFFGLFAAAQFLVWSAWRGKTAGHLAVLLTIVGAPMAALWEIVPRGGYVEFLVWALPTLAAYRVVARRDAPPASLALQAAWGFLLGLGFFINPLSLIVYATLALDWTFGRHGADLRAERRVEAPWLDRSIAPWVVAGAAVAWLLALAACCHVDSRRPLDGMPYVVLGGSLRNGPRLALGLAGAVGLLAAAAWWSRGPQRLYEQLASRPFTLLGLLAAWSPFVAYTLLVRMGRTSQAPSLPMWIGAPWKSGPNLGSAFHALGPLIGSAPSAAETVLVGQGVDPPPHAWSGLTLALAWASQAVVVAVCLLVILAAAEAHRSWRRFLALREDDVSPPIRLALLFLGTTAALYLLQGTSPNGSSIRYLVPIWVVLPGLMACGLLSLPRRRAIPLAAAVVIPWSFAQLNLWADLDRVAAARPLAEELERRGVRAIVAPTPVALLVANLSHGRVGAVEYQAIWPRLGERYADRLSAGGPLTCVVDRRFPWAIRGEGAWAPEQDFGLHLRGLARRHPSRARLAWERDGFEVWEVDALLDDVLALEPSATPRPDLARMDNEDTP